MTRDYSDYGVDADSPEGVIAATVDSAEQAARIMKALADLGYIIATAAPLHIVFTDFPGPGLECVFVEVETPDGKSINAGEWRRRPDGLAELVVAPSVSS